jgi:hypothetical protein
VYQEKRRRWWNYKYKHRHDKYLLAWVRSTIGRMFIICFLGNEINGKQSVARSRVNRTAVLQNPLLGNGSINTLPRITQQHSGCDFPWGPCRGVIRRPSALTGQSSKRIENRSTGGYKRSACEHVKCELKALSDVCNSVRLNIWRLLQTEWKDWRVMGRI